MFCKQKLKAHEKGNVLFLILIAVALFAALSYAVTSSSRSGGQSASSEKAQTEASALLSYAATVKQAYLRMRIMNNCTVFDNPDRDGFMGDPSVYPGKCNIYDSKNGGGGVTYNAYPPSSPIYTTAPPTNEGKTIEFVTMYVRGVGAPNLPEAQMIIFNIRPDICKAVNKILGIKTSDGEPPLEDSPYEGGFGGPMNGFGEWLDSITFGYAAGTENELKGELDGCYRGERYGVMGYHFYATIATN